MGKKGEEGNNNREVDEEAATVHGEEEKEEREDEENDIKRITFSTALTEEDVVNEHLGKEVDESDLSKYFEAGVLISEWLNLFIERGSDE